METTKKSKLLCGKIRVKVNLGRIFYYRLEYWFVWLKRLFF